MDRRQRSKSPGRLINAPAPSVKAYHRAWSDFYSEDISLVRFIEYVTGFNRPFLDDVRRWANGSRGIEMGCAEGLASVYLSLTGFDVKGIDLDRQLVDKATRWNEFLRGRATFSAGDIFDAVKMRERFDFAFSQGVLEHFDEDEVKKLLTSQLSVARRVIFSVPSRWHRGRDFGDERLRSFRQWRDMLEPFLIVGTFGYHCRGGRLAREAIFLFGRFFPRAAQHIRRHWFDTQIGFVIEAKATQGSADPAARSERHS